MRKEQYLVNASIEVHRAVFAMNEMNNKKTACTFAGLQPKQYIRTCIDKAIDDLKEARKGYPWPEKKRK